jgi:hypothetical protein
VWQETAKVTREKIIWRKRARIFHERNSIVAARTRRVMHHVSVRILRSILPPYHLVSSRLVSSRLVLSRLLSARLGSARLGLARFGAARRGASIVTPGYEIGNEL